MDSEHAVVVLATVWGASPVDGRPQMTGERGWLLSAVVAELGAAPVTVRRMRAELGVGKAWLVGEMRRLGFKQ